MTLSQRLLVHGNLILAGHKPGQISWAVDQGAPVIAAKSNVRADPARLHFVVHWPEGADSSMRTVDNISVLQ